jgi:subtilisin family serine protease
MITSSSMRRVRASLVGAAVVALVASVTTAGAAASGAASGATATSGRPWTLHRIGALPAGVPRSGSYAFLLALRTPSALSRYDQALAQGPRAAAASARLQSARIRTQQAGVVRALPRGSAVLYKTHNALAAVAVTTDVHNYTALQRISGVRAVYPIAPKQPSNSYAVPHVGAPTVWHGGNTGAGSTIAIIDTGVDYTHKDFGGTVSYNTAKTYGSTWLAHADPAKFAGGYDFAGDRYDPENGIGPTADPNPLDCDGHGTHVAGIAAGFGENASDGSTYTAGYAALSGLSGPAYRATFKIGPGMAPQAKILAYKVFGCQGSTNIIGRAIDRAIDPNRDGNPADHADVINMSLGSDFTSRQDGDAVLSNAASRAGITVVAAAGNAGDEYDATGSPGNAVRAIAVANSVDAYSRIDALHLTVNGAPQTRGAERSVLYKKWTTIDLTGAVKQVTQTGNTDGCRPVTQDLVNKVALVAWHDALPHCPSKTVATNLSNAGARGFILGDDTESFSAGINGNAAIPGVLLTRSGTSAIKTALGLHQPVTVASTEPAAFEQLLPQLDEKVNASSSRGIRAAGDVKPDVTGVGTSVFSAAMGKGTAGVSFSGTSMASPMVAGLAALIRSAHPNWTPEQVKADIMNTAGSDLYTGGNHTGTKFAPNRVGAGRVNAGAALRNQVVAYVQNDPGAVSVSFGPVAVTAPKTLKKTIKVVNHSSSSVQYKIGYRASTSVPGVHYALSRSSITVAAHDSNTVTVELVASHPGRMTKTRDTTVAARMSGVNREFLADASGRVVFSPVSGTTVPLRVPVYAAPRPASQMHEHATLAMHGSGVQHGALHLLGSGLSQGSGAARIRSVVSGFELAARSGLAPTCRTASSQRCVHFADERAADLKYVGVTSDAPLHATPMNGELYFSITTRRAWSTPVGIEQFQIGIDTNADSFVDAILYNTRLGSSDVFLSELIDVSGFRPFVRDDELINDRHGQLDTALFDSDTMVLPVWLRAFGAFNGHRALPGFSSKHTRIRYGVLSFGETGLVDAVGVNLRTGRLSSSGYLTTDVLHPGVLVHNNSIRNYDTRGFLLNSDRPDTTLTVRRDLARYRKDRGKGALLIHFHNQVGVKAQVVTLKSV